MADILGKVASLLSGKDWTPPNKEQNPQPVSTEPKSGSSQPAKPGSRRANAAGRQLIKDSEGLDLEAYPDPGSTLGVACTKAKLPMRKYRQISGWETMTGGPWTIGYGHTGKMPDGSPVAAGKKMTLEQAEATFNADISEFEAGVARLVKVQITDNQFGALVSFSYNCGLDEDEDTKAEGLGDSSLLRKLNAGDYAGAAASFEDWAKTKNKETGEVTILGGLMKRRAAERDLFLKE